MEKAYLIANGWVDTPHSTIVGDSFPYVVILIAVAIWFSIVICVRRCLGLSSHKNTLLALLALPLKTRTDIRRFAAQTRSYLDSIGCVGAKSRPLKNIPTSSVDNRLVKKLEDSERTLFETPHDR